MARAALVAAVAASTMSCAIQADSGPRDIPVDKRVQLDPVDPDAGAATGTSRIFLVADGEARGQRLLRSVSMGVPARPVEVLQALLDGANEAEIEAGLRTALPPELELLSARPVSGTLDVDVSPEILELQASALRLAVAQIVFTANELEGVRAVRLRVEGETRAWPAGLGELQTAPLTVYDFAGDAESAQPPYPAVPTPTA